MDKTKSEFTNRTDRDDKRSNMVVSRECAKWNENGNNQYMVITTTLKKRSYQPRYADYKFCELERRTPILFAEKAIAGCQVFHPIQCFI